VIVILLAGAAFGGGLFLVWRGLFPPRPSLAAALAELRHLPEPAPVVTPEPEGGTAAHFGGPIARLLTRAGADWLVPRRLRPDLAITGRSIERHLAEQVALGVFGVLVVPLAAAVLLLGGVHLPLALPIWAALCCGAAGFFLPDLGVHGEAAQRRRDFRHALSSYLDLVVVALAGGAGVETALGDAASIGHGWAFEYLRQALDRSRLSRTTPWAALGQLGEELGVGELSELASSIALAGTEGARVRSSLGAKAMSLRVHELTDAESAEQASTEKMSLPVVLLFAGFLCFIAFPAVERVLTGF
jgi:Flp pilus assembly protein TadB